MDRGVHYSVQNTHKASAEQDLSSVLIDLLFRSGTRSAFGVSGGAIIFPYLKMTQHSDIEIFHAVDERSASFMAMGRALATYKKEIPILFGTAGPGMTNMMTGVASAYEEKIPIFVITGNIATSLKNRRAAQDSFSSGIDAVELFKPITAASEVLLDSKNIEQRISNLVRIARQSSRPVHLNIPIDVARERVDAGNIQQEFEMRSVSNPVLPPNWQDVLEQVQKSQKPLILAGFGVKSSGLQKELVTFAESQQIPVACTPHGKGAFPEDHPLFLGVFGFAAPDATEKQWKEYDPDLLMILGSRLGETASAGWSSLLSRPSTRIHIDQDSEELNRIYSVTHPLPMKLEDFFERANRWSYSSDRIELSQPIPPARNTASTYISSEIDPRQLMSALESNLPKNAILFSDIGNSMAWIIHHLNLKGTQDFYVPMAFGAMGSGIGMALGCASVQSNRATIAIAGDAATWMAGNELLSATHIQSPFKLIVLNDGGHGMVDHGLKILNLPSHHLRFSKRIHFEDWGKAMSIPSYTLRTPSELQNFQLAHFLSQPGPGILDLWIDPAMLKLDRQADTELL
jgi:acetolactate synthase-1/2/3 large subunit